MTRKDKNLLAAAIGVILIAALPMFPSSIVTSFFGQVGLWTNTTQGQAVAGVMNGSNYVTLYQLGQGAQFANAGAIGLATPAAGSTQHEADGVFGGAQGINVTTNAVGGAFYAFPTTNGTGTSDPTRIRLWGINPLAADLGKTHVLLTNEFDFNVTGTDTHILGMQWTGNSTVNPTSDSVAWLLGPLGTGIKWPVGLELNDGATTVGIQMGVLTTGNGQPSQSIRLIGRNGSGVVNFMDVDLDQNGNFEFRPTGGAATLIVAPSGSITQTGVAFASLPTVNGSITYCTNCTIANPCNSGGTGAIAKRLNGVNVCN